MESQFLHSLMIAEGDLCLAGPAVSFTEGEIIPGQSLAEGDETS